ncbi:MAG: Uma2 family endonuclease [Microcoleus sp.]|uniref:Uma2 family endonuclease n=1 Tax=Microcoleus sp. TaxID=44472 RepID=UPI003C7739E0
MKTLAKWSVGDYHRMIEAGILRDRPVELLAGEVCQMSPETPIHYNTTKRGTKYLEELLAGKADVRFNGPITLSDSEPEPDIAIVRLPESAYNDRHPEPQDIFWIVEVAQTSLKKDLYCFRLHRNDLTLLVHRVHRGREYISESFRCYRI